MEPVNHHAALDLDPHVARVVWLRVGPVERGDLVIRDLRVSVFGPEHGGVGLGLGGHRLGLYDTW